MPHRGARRRRFRSARATPNARRSHGLAEVNGKRLGSRTSVFRTTTNYGRFNRSTQHTRPHHSKDGGGEDGSNQTSWVVRFRESRDLEGLEERGDAQQHRPRTGPGGSPPAQPLNFRALSPADRPAKIADHLSSTVDACEAICVTADSSTSHGFSPAYTRYAFGLIFLVSVFNVCDRTIMSVLVPEIRADLGLSDRDLGILMGPAFAIVHIVAGIPIARLADRRSRRVIIAAGLFAWSLLTIMQGLARSFGQLLVARMGVGIGEARARLRATRCSPTTRRSRCAPVLSRSCRSARCAEWGSAWLLGDG